MEMYNFAGFGNAENYMIQGAETDFQLTGPLPEQTETMYNEGPAPEFIVDPGMYYPPATNYGYYCTGFEAPGEWEDQNRIFGVDGPDVQYPGAQSESLSYVYYTPTYGYAQSQYNPYNPYMHGAVIGPDGPYVGSQQYYTIPPYQSSVSSSPYFPVIVQPDIIPNSSPETFIDPSTNRSNGNGREAKYATSGSFYRNPSKPASNLTNSLARISERAGANVGPSNQSAMHGSISVGSFPSSASSHVFQGRCHSGSNQSADKIANGKVVPQHSQMKLAPPINSGVTDLGASAQEHNEVGKFRPKIHVGRALNDANVNSDSLGEQNRGPRINRTKNQLAVKAYTTKAGDSNAEGNIIIYTDQYNKDDFPLDYEDAKFFVIKSYSEDDVHKSIKYNVWSSTPHGNKKLNCAYEDAKRISVAKSRSCPIFLFFSVNASGQICGVAEMIGPVDFNKDMDFWQQDKWSGSFPVKWHIIKDIQNVNFRHILLENNENKPVTNSRDTQEITYKKGLEMLNTFKNHALKTSLLDDFVYYENRQKIMQDEKARSLTKRYEAPYFIPALSRSTRQLNTVAELTQSEDRKLNKANDDLSSSRRSLPSTNNDAIDITTSKGDSENVSIEMKDDVTSTLKIGSLSITPKQQAGSKLSSASTNSKSTEVTVGSVSIKVTGGTESSGILTVGTIPLDPRALQVNKEDAVKNGFPRN